jgi:LysM repeat protein
MNEIKPFESGRPHHGALRAIIKLLLLISLSAGVITSASAGETLYTVRSGDTLSAIALKHGISSSRLAQFNELDDPDKVQVGQRLRIPSGTDAHAGLKLSPAMRNTLAGVKVPSGRWKWVVIHHSATPVGNAKDIDRYHRESRHMENGLAYHFVIGNGHGMEDGEIAVGQRWLKQIDGGHVASEALNAKSIGICLIGNFEQTRPTDKQLDNLEALTKHLLAQCDLKPSSVRTHQQVGRTRCPGRHFPTKEFLKRLEK